MIKRENYLKKIRPFYDQNLIKVITGIRRCGKSVILKQIMDEIKKTGIKEENIIYINFEFIEYENLQDYRELNKYIKEKIDQGIDVIGICFKSYFFNENNAKRMTKQIGIKLEVVDFSKEHFEMVKNPKHGLGKNMNPCIDCHAMMMRYAGELLEKLDADFIITGEVLNQRPMSQNKQALNVVKKA